MDFKHRFCFNIHYILESFLDENFECKLLGKNSSDIKTSMHTISVK